jgi:3-isopropylmalate dehydratase small subunit
VIAPSFGDIFRTNAIKIGLLPVVLPADDVRSLAESAAGGATATVDLENQQVVGPDRQVFPFEFDAFARECLLQGLDDIGLTFRREDAIDAFEREHVPRVDTTALAV